LGNLVGRDPVPGQRDDLLDVLLPRRMPLLLAAPVRPARDPFVARGTASAGALHSAASRKRAWWRVRRRSRTSPAVTSR
jgi:hypothetical protein